MLEQLHSVGFIHGYIQVDNIVLKRNTRINFRKSEYRNPELALILLSPWHLIGARIGRRDDILSALEVHAQLLLPSGALYKYLQTRLIAEIENADFFMDRLYRDGSICDLYKLLLAMNKLYVALRLVRSILDVDARPPYEVIKDRLLKAIYYASGKPNHTSHLHAN